MGQGSYNSGSYVSWCVSSLKVRDLQ